MRSRNETISILGKTGEKIIVNELLRQGKKVEYSIDEYDSQKDLLVDGVPAEVKTEQPYLKKNSLTFAENQLRKCRSVEQLFFVTVPPLINKNYKWGGCIFTVDPKKFVCYAYTMGNPQKRMVGIPIEQDAVKLVRRLTEEEINILLRYADSKYGK